MPISKSKPSNSMDLVKQDRNDSLDTFIRQAGGKEPYLSVTRPDNGPVQLFQLLHAFDQPGWPLLTPLKVQMQKCSKCPREFCSPINYRRHIRVHRRLRKLEKDLGKDRDLLGAFWDKLSEDETKEIVSFKDLKLEEVPGSSVIVALTALIQRPGFCALPQYYLRAGSHLLDIIQAAPSAFPISSQELFSILDDASERTFLCSTGASMQKYVFDGETGKNSLEAKNVVASTSFLLEQKLIKAWLADKDAEALRCQKLLVEEEEAAQRRQEELLERKRRKKLRQKGQRAKDQRLDEDEEDIRESESGTSEEQHHQADSSSLLSTASDSDAQRPDVTPAKDSSALEIVEVLNADKKTNYETDDNFAYNNDRDSGQNMESRGGLRHMAVTRWQVPPKIQRGFLNGFHSNSGSHASKFGGMQKNGSNRDLQVLQSTNAARIWSRKVDNPKSASRNEPVIQLDQSKNGEVLIGSISVTLGNCRLYGGNNGSDSTDEHEKPKNVHEKSSLGQLAVKHWRPVSRRGSEGPPVENDDRELKTDLVAGKNEDSNETSVIDKYDVQIEHTLSLPENIVHHGSLQFNCHDAKVFMAQRWKEATAAEHVTLVLTPEAENVYQKLKTKYRMKPEKGSKVKYVPKQRTRE